MGGCVSSGSSARAPDMSALDLALTSRLQTYIATHPEVHASKSLTKVALSFTAMLKSFEAIRVVFTRVDADGNGTIEYDEFLAACAELRVEGEKSADLLRDVYETADVNHDGHVDFREFVMALTLAFLVAAAQRAERGEEVIERPNAKKETEAEFLAHRCLDKVLEAWLLFDDAGQGFITKKNVTSALATFEDGARGDHAAGASARLIRARFGEMHFGETETISFQEFLYAVEGWCGLDDEDEEHGS
jgi:Ca2+-binding EF-hand superfamily protein